MPKKPPVSDDDLLTFKRAIKGVKPLVQKQIRHEFTPSRPRAIKRKQNPEPFIFDESAETQTVSSEAFLSYQQTSISHKILRNLRKGQYNVEAVLDLHGMSTEKAQIAVEEFLQASLETKMRVVLIIHGKGHHSPQPILKNKLNRWLRSFAFVLAFCSAAPSHGSRGALYVLLKRATEEDRNE